MISILNLDTRNRNDNINNVLWSLSHYVIGIVPLTYDIVILIINIYTTIVMIITKSHHVILLLKPRRVFFHVRAEQVHAQERCVVVRRHAVGNSDFRPRTAVRRAQWSTRHRQRHPDVSEWWEFREYILRRLRHFMICTHIMRNGGSQDI